MLSKNVSSRIFVIRNVAIVMVLYINIYGYFSLAALPVGYVFVFVSQVLARSAVPIFFLVYGYLL